MISDSASSAPLLNRTLDDTIVNSTTHSKFSPCPLSTEPYQPISVRAFLHQANVLAKALPAHQHAINLCENRYSFLLTFCAVLIRQQTNLLPQNRGVATQQNLFDRYHDSYVLHDGATVGLELNQFDIRNIALSKGECETVPTIPLSHLAAIAFTSGSTGEPQPNLKTWNTFVKSTAINGRFMLPTAKSTLHQLATVPGQHMWGLETSILIPMLHNVCINDDKPLLPQDVKNSLERIPEPRMLVSTPVHLRALTLSGIDFPKVKRIMCATAPLSEALARDTEKLFHGELHEVFGCSEVGSMAIRRTSQTQTWNLFEGLNMKENKTTNSFEISANHLPELITLQDKIEQLDEHQFRLLGRGDDMLEIAGKRGSLQEMNKLLLEAPNVVDGMIFTSPDDSSNIKRLIAIVVFKKNPTGILSIESDEDTKNKSQLLKYFRERLDPAFIPRPVFVVSELPREENGKLPKGKLLAFYQKIKNSPSF